MKPPRHPESARMRREARELARTGGDGNVPVCDKVGFIGCVEIEVSGREKTWSS